MKQSDIIDHVMKNYEGKPRSEATTAYSVVCSAIVAALSEDVSVRLKGLGTLKVVDTKARTARNPKTGASIDIAAGKKVRFLPSQALKETVAIKAA